MESLKLEHYLALISIAVALVAPVGQVLFERFLQRRDERAKTASLEGADVALPWLLRREVGIVLLIAIVGLVVANLLLPMPITKVFILSMCISAFSAAYVLIWYFGIMPVLISNYRYAVQVTETLRSQSAFNEHISSVLSKQERLSVEMAQVIEESELGIKPDDLKVNKAPGTHPK